MSDSDDDEDSVVFDFDGVNAHAVNVKENPEAEYEGEFGFALVKALRGKTCGRRMRRNLFKFGFFQLFCGFPLFVITCAETEYFADTTYFDNTPYGASLLSLMWCASFPAFLLGILSMMAVRHWPSLVTNRTLVGNLLRIYVCAYCLIFIFTLWCICVLFLTFSEVEDWDETVTIAQIFPYYVSTVLFIMPLIASELYYILDFSYLIEDMDSRGGTIAEPNPPEDTMDLSDVTVTQSLIFVCAMPCILCVQLSDLLIAIYRAYETHYKPQNQTRKLRKLHLEEKKKAQKENKKKRRVMRRIWKTLNRWFRGAKKTEIRPVVVGSADDLELADISQDREKQERIAREREIQELEEKRRRDELAAAGAAAAMLEAQKKKRLEDELLEAQRVANEKRKKEEEAEKLRLLNENVWDKTLDVVGFKEIWAKFEPAGSFQCKLKSMPQLESLIDHMKKQGFHIVFASTPSGNVEVGVSNIRQDKTESWFVARFLAYDNSFSAVMKAEDATQVTVYVKKFALAKVLKIDKK